MQQVLQQQLKQLFLFFNLIKEIGSVDMSWSSKCQYSAPEFGKKKKESQ